MCQALLSCFETQGCNGEKCVKRGSLIITSHHQGVSTQIIRSPFSVL